MTRNSFITRNIYCDQRRGISGTSGYDLLVGGICCPRDKKRGLVHEMHLLREEFGTQGICDWRHVSPNRLEFYKSLVDYFVDHNELAFRCIHAEDIQLSDDMRFNLYRMYCKVICNWISPENTCYIYVNSSFASCEHNTSLNEGKNSEHPSLSLNRVVPLQEKTNAKYTLSPGKECERKSELLHPFQELQTFLTRMVSPRTEIACLQPVDAEQVEFIQLAGFLMGAIGYMLNGATGSSAKVEVCRHLAKRLKWEEGFGSASCLDPKFAVLKLGACPANSPCDLLLQNKALWNICCE